MPETATETKQQEFKGMPEIPGFAKLAYEWLERQAEINTKQDKQTKTKEQIIEALRKSGKQIVKIKDPETGEFREFKISEGHDSLQVRKIPEKIGQQK